MTELTLPRHDEPTAPAREPVGSDGQQAGPRRRSRRILITVVALAVSFALGGVVAAAFIKSPAQQAAETQPPPRTVLSAPVVRQVVRNTLVLRGSVSAASTYQVTPTSAQGAQQLVVTAAPKAAGSLIRAGDVMAEVSGRPVIALPGMQPAYRDLTVGAKGRDVAQLQSALAGLGFPSGDNPGSFGSGTAGAVARLYRRLAYPVPMTADPVKPMPMLPLAEYAFLPAFPSDLVSLSTPVGGIVKAPLLTIASGQLAVQGQLNPADASLVRPGMPVAITGTNGFHGAGTVSAVGPAGQGNADSGPGGGTTGSTLPGAGAAPSTTASTPVLITPSAAIDPSLLGQDVELQIDSAATAGPVLAVPVAAITAHADGSSYVTRIDRTGRRAQVAVRVGISGGGLVEIDPISAGLSAGDRVALD